jgi:hypothetical protein
MTAKKPKSRSQTEPEPESESEKRKGEKCPVCKGRFPAQNFLAHVKKCKGERIAEVFGEYERKRIEKARADLASACVLDNISPFCPR